MSRTWCVTDSAHDRTPNTQNLNVTDTVRHGLGACRHSRTHNLKGRMKSRREKEDEEEEDDDDDDDDEDEGTEGQHPHPSYRPKPRTKADGRNVSEPRQGNIEAILWSTRVQRVILGQSRGRLGVMGSFRGHIGVESGSQGSLRVRLGALLGLHGCTGVVQGLSWGRWFRGGPSRGHTGKIAILSESF